MTELKDLKRGVAKSVNSEINSSNVRSDSLSNQTTFLTNQTGSSNNKQASSTNQTASTTNQIASTTNQTASTTTKPDENKKGKNAKSPLEPPKPCKTFKTRADFDSDWEYEDYVKYTVIPGHKVKFVCEDEQYGLRRGDLGVVSEMRRCGMIDVLWSTGQYAGQVMDVWYVDIELVE